MEGTDVRAPIDRLVSEVMAAARRNDRGMLAALRAGLSEGTRHRAWPILASYCDLRHSEDLAIWGLVGAGCATLAPDGLARAGVGNIGATMRRLEAGGGHPDEKTLESFDGRFRRLLVCQEVTDLCDHLIPVLRAAKAKGVPIDFRKLYEDLRDWTASDVRLSWAAAYWGVPAGSEGTSA
jgi:CRISPR type I-E-associated protein CasB/Cse2